MEELQTDVMRFMAILAFCLIAVFAIVQVVPDAPPPPIPHTVVPAPPPDPPPPAVSERTTKPVAEPVPEPVEAPAPPPRTRPAQPAVADERPQPAAVVAPANTPAPPQGLTLRFVSDHALIMLVARRKVALYALAGDSAQRLLVGSGRLSFYDVEPPQQMHLMAPDTVPREIVQAYGDSGGAAGAVRWGVTLPVQTRHEVERIVDEHENGELIIDIDGHVRLARGS